MAGWIKFDYEELRPAVLPDVCAKTGEPSDVRIKTTVYQMPPWIYLFVLFGVVPFVFARIAFAPRLDLQIPATAKVASRRKQLSWGTAFGFILAIGLLFLGAVADADSLLVAGVLLILGIAIAYIIAARRMWILVRDRKDGIEFKNVHPHFVEETPKNDRPRADFLPYQPERKVKWWAAALAFLLALLSIGALFSSGEESLLLESYASGDAGEVFRDPSGLFQLEYPSAPEESTSSENAGDFNIDVAEYVVVVGGSGFTAAVLTLPADRELTDPLPFLSAYVEGAASENNGSIVNSSSTEVDGLVALEFLIDVEEGFLAGRVMALNKSQILVLQVLGSDNPPTGAERFFDSLRILR